jgi:5-methylcytosine-specific restriction endonuclease McrA
VPIKPENKGRYPKDWKDVRARILERAGNVCEECGVPNKAYGARDQYDEWHNHRDLDGYSASHGEGLWPNGYPHIITIVLTIAHLDHNPENNSDDNLKALCQRCHNRYDKGHRAANRKRTMQARRAERDARDPKKWRQTTILDYLLETKGDANADTSNQNQV